MTVRTILKMGDPRLLRVAQAVTQFDTDDLHLLVSDMLDTMRAAGGVGLAAPQGKPPLYFLQLRLFIFHNYLNQFLIRQWLCRIIFM